MIRLEVFEQFKLTKLTYALETDDKNGMGWSD